MWIDWTVVVSDVISGLVVGVVLAVLGYIFLNRYIERISFAEKMSSCGFSNVSLEKQTSKEVLEMCENASLIKIINVSGFHFLNANRMYITSALRRGCEIRFLCARPDSTFLTDIENMEINTFSSNGEPLRKPGKLIGNEVIQLSSEYGRLGMKVRFYSSEYRLPFVIAHYPDGSEKAWLTMTLPPYKSTKSFVLRGVTRKDEIYSSDINFIEMMETNFDTIWRHGSIASENYKRSEGIV